jgi:hypothetical protein
MLGCLTAACEGGPDAIVVHGGTIIDGTGSAPLVNGELVIVGGRIQCVGPTGSCERPPAFNDVAAAGFWIIPGLIDTHMHAFFDGDPDRSWRDERLRFLLGVTSTREASTAGNHSGNMEAARRGADPHLPLPRLLVAGRIEVEEAPDSVSGAEAVRRLAADGVSSIKLKAVFPQAALRGIVGVAHELDLDVWGHAWAEEPTRSLVREDIAAGYDGLAHLTGIAALAVADSILASPPAPIGQPAWLIWRRTLWAEADQQELGRVARELAAAGVWLEPLLVVEERWAEPYGLPPGLHRLAQLPYVVNRIGEPDGMPERSESDRERLTVSVAAMREFVKTFHEAGGVVVTGSDGALAPGLSLHEDIKALVRAGLTPEAALAAGTSVAADVIGASDSLGTLVPGKLADFVVLEGDPLADIRNIELVSRVAKAGVLHDPATLLDQLRKDIGSQLTSGARRLSVGLVAVLLVIGATVVAVWWHRRTLPHTG